MVNPPEKRGYGNKPPAETRGKRDVLLPVCGWSAGLLVVVVGMGQYAVSRHLVLPSWLAITGVAVAATAYVAWVMAVAWSLSRVLRQLVLPCGDQKLNLSLPDYLLLGLFILTVGAPTVWDLLHAFKPLALHSTGQLFLLAWGGCLPLLLVWPIPRWVVASEPDTPVLPDRRREAHDE